MKPWELQFDLGAKSKSAEFLSLLELAAISLLPLTTFPSTQPPSPRPDVS